MHITVVILNWNRAQEALRAADSVLRQDHDAFDLLVWDNASTDDSPSVLEKGLASQPNARVICADTNSGVAGGRNRAFAETTGDIVLFLDDDAYFTGTDALTQVEAHFREDPAVGAVSFEIVRPDGHLMWPFSRPAERWRTQTFETIRIDGGASAVRRTAFELAGGLAEHFSPYGAEDAHFAYKLIREGFRVLYLPSVQVVHAFSPKGRTSAQFIKHVRNLLWIPLELSPFPHNLLSYAKTSVSLLRDAIEQRHLKEYMVGQIQALTGFRWSRRQPLNGESWAHARRLIAEDRRG